MRKCKTCSHAKVAEINSALVRGVPVRDIARQYGLSKDTVYRHRKNCFLRTLERAVESQETSNANEIKAQLQDIHQKTVNILNRNLEKDDKAALSAIREARANLELIGRLIGELDNAPKVAVLVDSPDWAKVRYVIMQAVDPYPDARDAIINALQRISA